MVLCEHLFGILLSMNFLTLGLDSVIWLMITAPALWVVKSGLDVSSLLDSEWSGKPAKMACISVLSNCEIELFPEKSFKL